MKIVAFFTAVLAFAALNFAYKSRSAKPIVPIAEFRTPKPAPPADTNITMYGRGLYPGDDSVYYNLSVSGFTTVVLSSFYIHANGDVYSGDSGSPIIHNGEYVGDKEWLRRIASLKQKPGTVTRIEILLEGRWYNQPPNTFDYIQDWADPKKLAPGITTGTGKNSTLYKIAKVFKDDLGVDAVSIDDESVYNSASIIQFGEMLRQLKMHMSLCPFTNSPYWKAIMTGSKKGLIDAIYLQCYDGGSRNTPDKWVDSLGAGIPIYPIFLCRGSFSTCSTTHNSKSAGEIRAEMARFKKTYPGMSGGAIWQMEDVKSYVKNNCAIQDPQSGTATSAKEYMLQLKNSLLVPLQ